MFALLCTVLFGLGALAVDFGNMYQRKAEAQSQADLAAMSAAPALASSTSTATAQANARDEVLKYLKYNSKLGQEGAFATLTAAHLKDGNLTNGEVEFPSRYILKVTTPAAVVEFGLARIMGFSSANVAATATAGIGTPGAQAAVPFFAVTAGGCDYGSQSLTDPANGKVQASGSVPTLAQPTYNPGQSSNASLSSASPAQFDVGATGPQAQITLNGDKLASVDRIGYFRTPSESPNAVESLLGSANTNNNSITGATVPGSVTNAPGVWYLRVYRSNGSTGWSPADEALPIRVGDDEIGCSTSSSSGNFGTLKMARSTNPSTWAQDNIAVGLEPPLTLAFQTDPLSLPLCNPGGPSVVYTATTSGATRQPNTNCVDTDTGLTSLVVTQGLVTGTSTGYGGRLVRPTTTSVSGRACGVGKTSSERPTLGHNINNDTLTCFMNDPNASLASIASSSYSGGTALNAAVYDSPRFCFVPVFTVTPTKGGSAHYSITDVRPCFITGESSTSTYTNQTYVDGTASTTNNGLTIPNNRITTMQVFFFNSKALPDTGSAAPGSVLAPTGPLVPVLTD